MLTVASVAKPVPVRTGPRALAAGVAHHGLMFAAMAPCLGGIHAPSVLGASLVLVIALCIRSTARARRNQALLGGLIDDLAMLALLIAALLSGHGAATHHETGVGAFGLGTGFGLATAVMWVACRACTWTMAGSGQATVAAVAPAIATGGMVALMLTPHLTA